MVGLPHNWDLQWWLWEVRGLFWHFAVRFYATSARLNWPKSQYIWQTRWCLRCKRGLWPIWLPIESIIRVDWGVRWKALLLAATKDVYPSSGFQHCTMQPWLGAWSLFPCCWRHRPRWTSRISMVSRFFTSDFSPQPSQGVKVPLTWSSSTKCERMIFLCLSSM